MAIVAAAASLSPTPIGFYSVAQIGNRRRGAGHCSLSVSKLDRNNQHGDGEAKHDQVNESLGVKAALSMLSFYKREISPMLPKSCRYIPTCSEYSMEAYKKYGVVKGTILTARRLCRCNPLGGHGFDPPRWFDEEPPTQEE